MPFAEMDARQLLLAGVTLLLIFAHLFFPAAGVDDTSLLLLIFLAVTLYGNEITAWLAAARELAVDPPSQQSDPHADVAGRVRQLAYQVEHARIAAATENMPTGHVRRELLDEIVERSAGQPRAALLLIWAEIEDRLTAAAGVSDSLFAARRLVESGRAPGRFQDAFEAFRRLRNEVAQSAESDIEEEVVWSLVDIGASLLALVPDAGSPLSAGPLGTEQEMGT